MDEIRVRFYREMYTLTRDVKWKVLEDGMLTWCMDHIWPVSYGGKNRNSFFNGNLALACEPCNLAKSNKIDDSWVPSPLTNWQQVKSFILAILLNDIPVKGEDY